MDNRRLADPGRPDFQVEKYPFYLLNRLVGRYNVVIDARLRAIGLDIPYWRVLMVLGEKAPRGVREIADNTVIPLSTMTRIIQRMAADDLVMSRSSEQDGRVTKVSLTRRGEAKVAEARAATAPVYAKVIHGISNRDFDKITQLLVQMHANLEDLTIG